MLGERGYVVVTNSQNVLNMSMSTATVSAVSSFRL